MRYSASSLLRSGCLLISKMGLMSSDIRTDSFFSFCFTSGIITFTFLLRTDGICIGVICCLVTDTWFISFYFIWLILGLWLSPLNYEGFTADASGKARFSGKIPQHSEDDFFRNHIGMTLPSERSICHFCPVVHRLANGMYVDDFLVLILFSF